MLMKCVNARLNDELIQFDCPNCGVDVEINEGTLDELWESFDGMVTCPLPEGCNSFIKVPTHEELDQLKKEKTKMEYLLETKFPKKLEADWFNNDAEEERIPITSTAQPEGLMEREAAMKYEILDKYAWTDTNESKLKLYFTKGLEGLAGVPKN